VLATCDSSLLGRRDRALLCLGFAGALRHSELVGLEVADFAFGARGLTVTVRRSKTDQEGKGQEIAVPHGASLLPVASVQEWLQASGILAGPVFRPIAKGGRLGEAALTAHAVACIVKKRAVQAGLDPVAVSGHSLRAGEALGLALGPYQAQQQPLMLATLGRVEHLAVALVSPGGGLGVAAFVGDQLDDAAVHRP
jgi:integrase